MKNSCIVCNMGHSNTEIDVVIYLSICVLLCVYLWIFWRTVWNVLLLAQNFSSVSVKKRSPAVDEVDHHFVHSWWHWQCHQLCLPAVLSSGVDCGINIIVLHVCNIVGLMVLCVCRRVCAALSWPGRGSALRWTTSSGQMERESSC